MVKEVVGWAACFDGPWRRAPAAAGGADAGRRRLEVEEEVDEGI